jgi:hypothetical protein
LARSIHSGNTGVLGHRVGAGGRPGEPANLKAFAPRLRVSFVCSANKHETICNFAATAKVPDSWACPKCGTPAYSGDPGQIPQPTLGLRHAEHLQRVKDRRCEAAREAILQEALDRLHERRLRDQALASQDVLVLGVTARATQPPPALSGEIQLAGAVRCQPKRRSRAQRLRAGGVDVHLGIFGVIPLNPN